MSKPLLCRLGFHKFPPVTISGKSLFKARHCLRCDEFDIVDNFRLPE